MKRPPALAQWLLSLLLPPSERDSILGDVAEEYDRNQHSRVWYWQQWMRIAPFAISRSLRQDLSRFGVAIFLLIIVTALSIVGGIWIAAGHGSEFWTTVPLGVVILVTGLLIWLLGVESFSFRCFLAVLACVLPILTLWTWTGNRMFQGLALTAGASRISLVLFYGAIVGVTIALLTERRRRAVRLQDSIGFIFVLAVFVVASFAVLRINLMSISFVPIAVAAALYFRIRRVASFRTRLWSTVAVSCLAASLLYLNFRFDGHAKFAWRLIWQGGLTPLLVMCFAVIVAVIARPASSDPTPTNN